MATSNSEPSTKTLDDLPRKLVKFAELLASGMTAAKAARECGYSKSVATSRAYAWIGKTREQSLYPCLWDHYAELKRERLRLFNIEANSVLNELKLIAFSSIDNYLDFGTRAAKEKIDNLTERLHAEESALENEDKFLNPEYKKILDDEPNIVERSKKLRGVRRFNNLGEKQKKKIEKLSKDLQRAKDAPGAYLRLKYLEDIPAELMPAIAEIRETKEGVAVKLHSKMDALDKLARYLQMFAEQKPDGDESLANIKEILIQVSGTRSRLLPPGDPATPVTP
jgi:phage terminase small subunit